jgi:L-ribulose-5-phosphate 4-epimerase
VGDDRKDLRETLVSAVGLLFEAGVMSASGHGNASVLDGADGFWMTSGGQLRGLEARQLVLVPLQGEARGLDPTNAEVVEMHRQVYLLGLEGVSSVIHTHSPAVTAFALANRPLPCRYEAMLRFGLDEDVPVAAWAPRGSPESVSNILGLLRERPSRRAVLLGNHGLLAMGPDPVSVARLIMAMEEGAAAVIAAESLGGARPFPSDALGREREHMARYGHRPPLA